jgi:hypothetical protein
MRKKVSFKDVEEAGHGVRNTVKGKQKKHGFPECDGVDETGHPFWWEETIEKYEKKITMEYVPKTPAHVDIESLLRSQRRSIKRSIAVRSTTKDYPIPESILSSYGIKTATSQPQDGDSVEAKHD